MGDDTKRLIRNTLSYHLNSAKAAITGLPLWVWPVPIVLALAALAVTFSPLGWMTAKPVQEVAAPVVIGMTAVLSFFVHRWTRETFTLLLTVFCWTLFARELHFTGTNNGAYIAIVVLAWLASTKRAEIGYFLRQRPVSILLGGAMLTYFVTKVFDRGYLAFLPDYRIWHSNVEETMETCGHLMVFALVVFTLHVGSALSRTRAAEPEPVAALP